MGELILADQVSLFNKDDVTIVSDFSNSSKFQTGFRYITIFADINNCLPPKKNSATDIALLRASNLALKRSVDGCKDAFLFISPIVDNQDKIANLIKEYGFIEAEVICLDCGCDQFDSTLESDIGEDIEVQIERWLSQKHPEAIAFCESPYAFEQFWWTGIEYDPNQDKHEWPFDVDQFKTHLPNTHRHKPKLWLAILAYALEIDSESLESNVVEQDKATALAATLCEWLHGFESAAGNSYNGFDHEYFASSVGPSDFFLGFQSAKLTTCEIDGLSDNYDCSEIDEIRSAGFKLITENLRHQVSIGLSNFFSGDTQLFWALYSAIWPKFDMNMDEAIEELISMKYIDYDEIAYAWEFVTTGWCDKAGNE